MGLTHSPKIVTDGLVLCLDAANTRSYPGTGTTWTDLKGGNSGTLTNMDGANFSSDNGGSLSFDGSDEYIDYGDILDDLISDSLTMCCFCNLSTLSGVQNIFTKSASYWLHKESSTQKFRFKVETSSGRKETEANLTLSTNRFYFVVGVLNSSSISIYVDGVKYTETSFSGTFNKSSYPLRVGAWALGPHLFRGSIANASIYNRALTADEVQQNYNATKGRFQ
jgi:hypothetical protein